MRVIRSGDAEKAFEEAFSSRGESALIIDVARRAACRGRLEEVEVCLDRLREMGVGGQDELEAELHAIVRSVRAHPSYSRRLAG